MEYGRYLFDMTVLALSIFVLVPVKYSLGMSAEFTKECEEDYSLRNITYPQCDSCETRCGQKNSEWEERKWCHCDQQCLIYGDCCSDFQNVCPVVYHQSAKIREDYAGSMRSACVGVLTHDTYDTVLEERIRMINQCSMSGYGCAGHFERIQNLLENGGPVIDKLHGVYFFSRKCAHCNGIPNHRLKPLDVAISCGYDNKPPFLMETQEENISIPIDLSSEILEFVDKWPCKVVLPISNTTAVRSCVQAIDTCPPQCRNDYLVQLCETYGLNFVEGTHGSSARRHMYTNIYCALCNPGNISQFICSKIFMSGGLRPTGNLNLYVYFDFSEHTGLNLASVRSECMFEGWVPRGAKCGETVCAMGYILTKQRCVEDLSARPGVVTLPYEIEVRHSEICDRDESFNTGDLHNELKLEFVGLLQNEFNVSHPTVTSSLSQTCKDTLKLVLAVYVSQKSDGTMLEAIKQTVSGEAIVNKVFSGVLRNLNIAFTTQVSDERPVRLIFSEATQKPPTSSDCQRTTFCFTDPPVYADTYLIYMVIHFAF